MSKKKVYVIYTGGTIGMQRAPQGYQITPGHLQQQLQLNPNFHHPELPDFFVYEQQPLIDSSDITPHHWSLIAENIQQHYNDYDGFVVLHGTDTMAFTASALSFMLHNLAKPVILTGSQVPLEELRSDGQSHLLHALYLAAHYPIHEVCLFFNQKLLRGNRATKIYADGFDAFISPNFPLLLEAEIQLRYHPAPCRDVASTQPSEGKRLCIAPIATHPIGITTFYPGIPTQMITQWLTQTISALILRTYGVGNSPCNREILHALEKVIAQDIPVINTSQCLFGKVNMTSYANGALLSEMGVISGYDMTLECVVAKLNYLLSQSMSLSALHQQMEQSLRGELTNPTHNSV